MYHIALNNFYMEICADVNVSLLYYVSILYRKKRKEIAMKNSFFFLAIFKDFILYDIYQNI